MSFLFTMIYGYAMARVAGAERVMLPVLVILQSIPVLGFLPGFVLGLVHLFPHQNLGLEIASVLMIFTGQVWNMTFSFYSSLKSVPPDLVAVARLARMSWWERFCRLDLSFAATGLLWNSEEQEVFPEADDEISVRPDRSSKSESVYRETRGVLRSTTWIIP